MLGGGGNNLVPSNDLLLLYTQLPTDDAQESWMKIKVVVNGRVRVQECSLVNSCGVR